MLYTHLANRLQSLNEETSGGMVGVATTQGNPSVAYLPGGFTSMRNMLQSLSPVKKQWGLEVLEEKENYRVRFEKALDIIVPKHAYEEFNARVLNTLGKKHVDLTEMLNEDVQEATEANFKKLEQLLGNLKRIPAVAQMIVLVATWRRLFPKSVFVPKESNVMLGFDSYTGDLAAAITYIRKLYSGDLGKLEELVHAISSQSPLNALAPFKQFDYLMGGQFKTDYQGVTLVLDLGLDMSYHPAQSIHVEDQAVLEELKGIKTLKVVDTNLVPVSVQLSVRDLTLVKKITDDAVNAEKHAPTQPN